MVSAQRATGATKLNAISSRSHAVCVIIVERSTVLPDAVTNPPVENPGLLTSYHLRSGLPRRSERGVG